MIYLAGQTKENIQEQIDEESLKRKLNKVRHQGILEKIDNIFEIVKKAIFIFLRLLLLISLSLALIALLFALGWLAYSYIWKQTPTSERVMTIVQYFTGLISLGVGFWGVVLTINSLKKSRSTSENLQIEQFHANSSPSGERATDEKPPN